MTIHSHRDLEVWKLAMELVDDVYKLTRSFPSDERFGLTSQFRRCACSVPMNIAEGKGRGTRKDFAHFVAMSKGSLMEAETLLEISMRQGYVSSEDAQKIGAKITSMERMLSKLRSRLIGVTHDPSVEQP